MNISYRANDPYFRDMSGTHGYALTRGGCAVGRTNNAALLMAERMIKGEVVFLAGQSISEVRIKER
jgi:hypothetical protein